MRIGLIGVGKWGRHILRDLKTLGCEVVAVARSEESILRAKEGNADLIVHDLKDLGVIDGAVISATTSYHGKLILDLLEQYDQLPIFVEKPLCLDLVEAEKIYDKDSDNVFVMDKWRYHNGVIAISEMVSDGKFGALKGLKIVRQGWGLTHKDIDCLWMLLPHDLAIIQEIMGFIPETQYAIPDLAENKLLGLMSMMEENGLWVTLDLGIRHKSHSRSVKAYFEQATVELSDAYADELLIVDSTKIESHSKPVIRSASFENEMPLYVELENFIGHIKGSSPPPKSSAAFGYEIVKRISEIRSMANLNSYESA